MRIDAHQHFWNYDAVRDSWINEDMQAIRRDFLPSDLQPILLAHQMDGCVAVQADQSLDENTFLLELAEKNDFIKGIVGWVDFEAADLPRQLDLYSKEPLIKGFRHVLQGEPQRDYMLRPAFMQGISQLKAYDFTYDILIFPDQLAFAYEFAKTFPQTKLVIDHIAKPNIGQGEMETWQLQIKHIATLENVSCKLSGMITEANWHQWEPAMIHPYMEVVLEAFGAERIMFGSDWPVCLVAGSYGKVIGLVEDYIQTLSANEQAAIMGGNAARFYRL